MPAKEAAALSQLLDLLESRYAVRVLWALRDAPPPTFRQLQERVGGITPNTLNSRLRELRDAGLADHGGEGYALTSAGLELVRRLADLPPFAVRWSAALARRRRSTGAPE